MARPQRILLISASRFNFCASDARIDCCSWKQGAKIPNIRDYDTVIMSVLGLEDEAGRDAVDWDAVFSRLRSDAVKEAIIHHATFIVIGDPRFSVSVSGLFPRSSTNRATTDFLRWAGMDFEWDDESGTIVDYKPTQASHHRLKEYIKRLSRWEYSLVRARLSEHVYGVAPDPEIETWGGRPPRYPDKWPTIGQDFFCVNRVKNGLAFRLCVRVMQQNKGYLPGVGSEIAELGSIYFLPRINASEEETLTIVVRDLCQLELTVGEPGWIEEFVAPRQQEIDEEIATIEAEIEAASARYHQAKERRDISRIPLKLLYEREGPLEPIVRSILRELGSEVTEPPEANVEDGWIKVAVGESVYEGVLEIKSTRSDTFPEDGIRQLSGWVQNGIEAGKDDIKGIFIGSSAVDKPLDERKDAFSDRWIKGCQRWGFCALKTEDLYLAYSLHSTGEIDMVAFWTDVFETNGIFDMAKYTPDRE